MSSPYSSQESNPTDKILKKIDDLQRTVERYAPRLDQPAESREIFAKIRDLPASVADYFDEGIDDGPGEDPVARPGQPPGEEDEDDDEEVDQLRSSSQEVPQEYTKEQKRQMKITKRAQDILGSFSKGPRPADAAIRLIRDDDGSKTVPKAEAEKQGLIYLIRGYYGFDPAEMYAIRDFRQKLRPYKQGNVSLDAQCAEWVKENDILDFDQRLYSRRGSLEKDSAQQAGASYISNVCHQARTIMFMHDFHSKSSGPGGGAWVRNFYAKAFKLQSKYAPRFRGLNENETAQAFDSLTEEYKEWKRREETTVTARNRLFYLYYLFGPAVLLDPRWFGNNLGSKASKEYASVLAIVANQIRADVHFYEESSQSTRTDEFPHFSHQLVGNAEEIILMMAKMLGSDAIETFMKRFMGKFWFNIDLATKALCTRD